MSLITLRGKSISNDINLQTVIEETVRQSYIATVLRAARSEKTLVTDACVSLNLKERYNSHRLIYIDSLNKHDGDYALNNPHSLSLVVKL